jgi:flagellar hook-associated protein 2
MSSSNSINLAAVGFGGIDTSTLVTSLVALEQQPITQLQNTQSQIQSASSTISSFSNDLSALSTAVTALSDPSTFQVMSASSSDPSVVATASGKPVAGQWSVSVQQIAQAQRSLSNGTPSASTALGLSGSFEITTGSGGDKTVNVSSTDTLQDVANAISSSGLGVQAGVMFDGTNYKLLVSGQSTGTNGKFTIDESGLTSSSNPPFTLGMSNLQDAKPAIIQIGGANGPTITSQTNQVTNAIPGVTLALTAPTTSAATISIAGDSSSLQQQVQSFVTAYNNIILDGHAFAGYGKTAASNPLLQGDQAIRSTLGQLGQLAGEHVPGTSGAYTTLASVGIKMADNGELVFDSNAFQAAVSADPSGVQRLFVTDATNGSTGIMSQFNAVVNTMTDPSSGAIQAEINGFGSRSANLGQQISNGQQRIAAYQTQLQNEFSKMNQMLAQYKQIATTLNQSNGNNNNSNSVL